MSRLPYAKHIYPTGVAHPAPFSNRVMSGIREMLSPYSGRVLDPFAGTGRIHELQPDWTTVGVEIEAEWAEIHPDTLIGDALSLPFGDCSFEICATSVVYGNRLSDHYNASDPENRRSYTFDLGRKLSDNNSGMLHWGQRYRDFHELAWLEAARVLTGHGVLLLNIKDHVRKREVQKVTDWHQSTIESLGFELVTDALITGKGMNLGANRQSRTPGERLLLFEKR